MRNRTSSLKRENTKNSHKNHKCLIRIKFYLVPRTCAIEIGKALGTRLGKIIALKHSPSDRRSSPESRQKDTTVHKHSQIGGNVRGLGTAPTVVVKVVDAYTGVSSIFNNCSPK